MFIINNKIKKIALYILENNATIREAATHFSISKTTVHKYLTIKLEEIDSELFKEIQIIMNNHLETRHIKGGEVTKKKYESLRK